MSDNGKSFFSHQSRVMRVAKGLDITSWLVAAIVSVAILVVVFGNAETVFHETAAGALGSAGYLLAIFLHFKSKSLN